MEATPVRQTFAITPPAGRQLQTITFGPLPDRDLGSVPFFVTATASSGLQVLFFSTTPNVCSSSGAFIQLLAVGACSITATHSGNSAYAAAAPVTRTFSVLPSPFQAQTISFGPLPARSLGAIPFGLTGTASSALPITYATNTPDVCILTGSLVTLVAVGQCSITARQAGNNFYFVATPVTQTFTVSIAPILPVISGIQDAAGYAPGRIAPGSYATLRGEHLLPSPQAKLRDSRGVERVLEQIFAADQQINVIVPADAPLGSSAIIVSNANGASEFPVTISTIAPGIFSANSEGGGYAAANVLIVKNGATAASLVTDGPIALPSGSDVFIQLYGTGLRGHSPNGVTAAIGPFSVDVIYAGPQGTYPALDQVNLRVPAALAGFGLARISVTVDGIVANTVTATFQ
jgi:uncharacterized protein (TIGR03437 family)